MVNKNTSVKKRNWGLIVYPTKPQLENLKSEYDGWDGYGSAPDDWIDQLQLSGLQYAISPLHDKDKLPNGKVKKPHWHVILCYGNPTTYNNVNNLAVSFNAPAPQALEQIRGYYRYFTHQDNPDKYQYRDADIQTGGGFDIADFIELSKSEVIKIKRKLQCLIREINIFEYGDLMDYLLDNELSVEYEIASNNTYFFDKYISSKRNKMKSIYHE